MKQCTVYGTVRIVPKICYSVTCDIHTGERLTLLLVLLMYIWKIASNISGIFPSVSRCTSPEIACLGSLAQRTNA